MAKKIVSALGKFSNSTSSGNDDTYKQSNIADYTVAKKVEGKYKTQRILFWVVSIVAILALILVGCAINSYLGLALIVFSVMVIMALNYFLFRYLKIEYSYAIENSELICTEIYGNTADKLLLRIKTSSIERVIPYEGEYKAEVDRTGFEKKTDLRSTPNTDQAYCVLYRKDDGKKGVVFLEACNKTLKAFKYYNSQNTVVKEMRR